ncbi:hypothetical protein CWI36_1014p0010 [Hamiltosporidium magnivora]|uniref:Uncharacterized protein n=1 Tax=Hamiltosporidium magnivora TaxID=148818 RepID=A0A4Q9L5T9_9MICR|nr:hypothetical protein CWI36_1014p0010 [Hamiltosporidium magnivora]
MFYLLFLYVVRIWMWCAVRENIIEEISKIFSFNKSDNIETFSENNSKADISEVVQNSVIDKSDNIETFSENNTKADISEVFQNSVIDKSDNIETFSENNSKADISEVFQNSVIEESIHSQTHNEEVEAETSENLLTKEKEREFNDKCRVFFENIVKSILKEVNSCFFDENNEADIQGDVLLKVFKTIYCSKNNLDAKKDDNCTNSETLECPHQKQKKNKQRNELSERRRAKISGKRRSKSSNFWKSKYKDLKSKNRKVKIVKVFLKDEGIQCNINDPPQNPSFIPPPPPLDNLRNFENKRSESSNVQKELPKKNASGSFNPDLNSALLKKFEELKSKGRLANH